MLNTSDDIRPMRPGAKNDPPVRRVPAIEMTEAKGVSDFGTLLRTQPERFRATDKTCVRTTIVHS